ncbi:27-O-demethylrifamycin SV methyltransferase [Halioglobus japonicus]|nr:27-O-demethylrifamycin SV methyltransferase [Halioglobus japonicus]
MTKLPVSAISPDSAPAKHYDTVVAAWGELLQEDLHYGYFHTGREQLVEATNALTDQMLELAALQPDSKVLDVGCGTGKAGCRMASEHAACVVGISPSKACVEKAQTLSRSMNLHHLAQFCDGDGTNLQYADESFDCVWVMESSHLMQDKPALLRECARVLRPGGRVVLCDIMVKQKLALEDVIHYRDEFLLLRDVFGRAIMEPLSFYQEQFEGLGLQANAVSDISSQTYPTFDRWRQNASENRESVCRLIGEHAWEQFSLSCDVLEKFWQENILCYGIICAQKSA